MPKAPAYIGEMRWRIELQTPTGAKDAAGFGQMVDTWETLITVWAKKEQPLTGNREAVFGDMETAVTRVNWYIHFRDGLTTRHRIKEGPETNPTYYDIMTIQEIGYRDKLLLITEKRTP